MLIYTDIRRSSMAGSKFIHLILCVIGLWSSLAWSVMLQGSSMAERHEQWMARYGRTYPNEAEKERRFEIFKANVEYIESFNRDGTKPYGLGVNGFADLTNEEFQASRNGYDKPVISSGGKPPRSVLLERKNETVIPASVDWRVEGAVTPVKDQGQCGIHNIVHCSIFSGSCDDVILLVPCFVTGELVFYSM